MYINEIWKDVVGYEGYYKVSNKGNVYSVERKDSMGRKWGGRTLKPIYDNYGYLVVSLHKNGKQKVKKIHRLITEAFIPNPNNYPDVNHRDEEKDNNELSNLEWCDKGYNNNHGTRNERAIKKLSKRVRAVNVETGEVVTFNSTREAGRKGYHQGSVAAASRGDYNTGGGNLYRGYEWYYQEEK